ncbi:MAG: glycoside hydrolase family 20 protein [Paludibacter sp.]|nr:glycoside hydrolase family 20 protein [Paludibacter sp.]
MKIFVSSPKFLFCFMACLALILQVKAADRFNIIPFPQILIPQNGNFKFDKKTVLSVSDNDTVVKKLAGQFAAQLKLVSGINLQSRIANSKTRIEFIKTDSAFTNKEAYRLMVSPRFIRIEAATPNGFFYALQTIYQLLPADIYGKTRSKIKKWEIPGVRIEDAPRFLYRGLHLDVARHFFSVEFIKKYIDAMAIHKLNRFHWHLTEDQGWRIEIKKYPELTRVGSKRIETLVGNYYENMPQRYDSEAYGGFYTQQEAREIVAYAAERFITVIPEIEMPGHAMAAIASYPYLSCTRQKIKVATLWGIFDDVFCPRDSTFDFLENVLTEVMDIFPSEYIHIGGDECPKTRWKTCPDCQAKIKELGLKNEYELQSYFIQRIEKFVNSKGRKIIGWDEILEGGLAPNATVMSWRGTEGGIAAAKSGHEVIMTPMSHCYFDFYQADPATEPTAIGGFIPLQKVYLYEPVPAELNAKEARFVLGAQANVWTEYMPTSAHVEYMAFPRVSAMAEVLWTNPMQKSWDRFRENMPKEFDRLKVLEINAAKAFYDLRYETSIPETGKLGVKLFSDDPKVEIHYTTDGSIPTINAPLYSDPFELTASTKVKAQNFNNGKATGKELDIDLVVSKITGIHYKQITKNKSINESRLTDGITGNKRTNTLWVGFTGNNDTEIVFDLLTEQWIQRFSAGFLNAPALCVVITPEITIFTSVNGIDYNPVASDKYEPSTKGIWSISRPELIFPITKARFVKVLMKNPGLCINVKNQQVNSTVYIDEIGIW